MNELITQFATGIINLINTLDGITYQTTVLRSIGVFGFGVFLGATNSKRAGRYYQRIRTGVRGLVKR